MGKKRIEELEKMVDFLSRYNKNDVAIMCVDEIVCKTYSIRYLYDGKIMDTATICYGEINFEIIKNTENTIILKKAENYLCVDKATANIVKIPKPAFVLEQELAEKKSTAKKDTKKCN